MSTSAPPPSPSPQPGAPRPPRPPRQIIRRILDIPMSREDETEDFTIGEGNCLFPSPIVGGEGASEGDESAPSRGRARGWDSPVESRRDLDDLDDESHDDHELRYDSSDEYDDPYDIDNHLSHPPFSLSSYAKPQWPTLAELVADVIAFAHANDFNIARFNTRGETDLSVTGSAYLRCTCAGIYHTRSSAPSKATSTQKSNCPWYLYASRPQQRRRRGQPQAPMVWSITGFENTHNHLPLPAITNRGLRAKSFTKHVAYIEERLNLNDTPGQIYDALTLRDRQCLVRPTDISHFGYRLRQRSRLGHSAAEDAVQNIIAHSDLHEAFVTNTRALLGLFYSTHTARTLFARYPSVIFIDATYKTNRYGLRMLHFAGFTATNRTYTMATMFMLREDESWFKVALETFTRIMGRQDIKLVVTDRDKGLVNAIHTVWPGVRRVTCYWHLKENVRQYCAGGFKELDGQDGGSWQSALSIFVSLWESRVVRAKTVQDFEEGMEQLRMTYHEPQHAAAITYLEEIAAFADLWADHHLDQVTHYGQRTNSRLEGLHRALKRHIVAHNQDMLTVIKRLRLYFSAQWEDLRGQFLIERSRPRNDIGRHLEAVRLRVSRYALRLITEQLRLAKQDLEAMRQGQPERPCTGVFRVTMGLPCAHDIYPLLNQDRKLDIATIDRCWWLPTAQGLDSHLQASRAAPVVIQAPIVLPDEFSACDDLDNAILNPVIRTYSGAPKRVATQAERAVGTVRARNKRLEKERKAREREEKKAEKAAAAAAKKAQMAAKKAEMAKKKADKGKKRARPSPNDRENDSQASPPPSQPFTQLPPPSTYASTGFSFSQPHFSQPGPSRHPNALNLTYEQSQAETWYRPSPSPFQPPVPSYINPFLAPSHLQNAHYRPIQHLSQSQASHLSSYGGGGGYGGGGENESESPNESLTREVSGFGGFGRDSRAHFGSLGGEIPLREPERYSLREEPVQPEP